RPPRLKSSAISEGILEPVRQAHPPVGVRDGQLMLAPWSSFLAEDPIEHDLADHLEPHSEVEFNCAMVRDANMQPGHKVVTTMISDDFPDDGRSDAFATMRRIYANAADFGVAVEHQALAAHRNQLPVRSHAAVRAHFTRLFAKEAGERQVCERDH